MCILIHNKVWIDRQRLSWPQPCRKLSLGWATGLFSDQIGQREAYMSIISRNSFKALALALAGAVAISFASAQTAEARHGRHIAIGIGAAALAYYVYKNNKRHRGHSRHHNVRKRHHSRHHYRYNRRGHHRYHRSRHIGRFYFGGHGHLH